jgi:glycosyltransferase involved in cell wall biosynthesis
MALSSLEQADAAKVAATDPHSVGRYVLLTAAHNEEANIEKALRSVISQTILPIRWIIVSDNSTDRTDEIIQSYSARYPFIEFVKVVRPTGYSFAAKIRAIHEGYKHLSGLAYEFIGNLDADIELENAYFEGLLHRMQADPKLGIAAGFVYEEMEGRFQSRDHNRLYSVAHAAQLVRRPCYEAIGGYAILKFGGEDTHATTSARMNGWDAKSFADLKIYHQRHTGTRFSLLRSAFRGGRMDYYLGYGALFELIKSAGRLKESPLLIGGFARLLGFFWPYLLREPRAVSSEYIAFVRKEQRGQLTSRMSTMLGLKNR